MKGLLEMSNETRIIIVDDEAIVRESLADWLIEDGYDAVPVGSGREALKRVKDESWNAMFLDIKMPGMDGLEVLKRVRELDPDLPVLMITAYGTVATAVEAMKEGAYDYILKPIDAHEIGTILKRLIENQSLARANILMQQTIEDFQFEDLIGKSPAMQAVFEMVRTVAESDSTVLVTGESGTGKELIARAVHSNSRRRYMQFVAASLGASPETLVESVLFGHEKGAFTGANHMKKGRFELADGGTLFLDEIGDISSKTQIDLLRVLETQQFTRLGGTEVISVDTRIISATNRELEKAIGEGQFRHDLYYRLNVVRIHIPPLRERREDIPLLAEHFLGHFCAKTNKRVKGFQRKSMELLTSYDWPGNVRELENAIERAVVVSKGTIITPGDLVFNFATAGKEGSEEKSLKSIERHHISEMLEQTGWNITKTAEILEVDRVTLYNKIKKYGLER